METRGYVYRKGETFYVGWWSQYPEYITQGISLEELEVNLLDIYSMVQSGELEATSKYKELAVPV